MATTVDTATIHHTDVAGYHELVAGLKESGFALCSDVTAVDYLTHPGRTVGDEVAAERFEVVVNLVSMADRARARVRCQVPAGDPRLPTITDLYAGADTPEREVYDMFGIVFEGHPDLTRILMPEDWEGHPLRKDYPAARVPVTFKGDPHPR